MKNPLRIGVIGIGFGQHVHIPAFRTDNRCIVTAICATTAQRALKVADSLSIEKSFGDWKELISDQEIDALSIAVPPILQEQIALEALKNGKAIFCEKPLSNSVANAELIVDAAKKSNLANVIDFEFPEIPQWQTAKQLIDTNSLGHLHKVSIVWKLQTYANRMGIQSWKTDSKQGGGALNSFVSHCLHYVEWFLGPIDKIKAMIDDSSVLLNLELISGTKVIIEVETNAIEGKKHHLEFQGEKASLVLTNSSSDHINGFELFIGDPKSNKFEPVEKKNNWRVKDSDGRVQAVSCLTTRFVNWIIDGSSTRPSLLDGLRVQELLGAAQLSASEQQWVECNQAKTVL